ncbi:unnamed protein product [Ostreobium quekettii]|uniref:BRCT domain-containing protein n=1 Tax=Ostreobium quekettii TaxID=121088 RepID=A0A8S1J8T9_9CHLO|nr:unnamed protein product [Ostreobium quekettii]|eukprot:evm.model.scf_624.7 EVM.evm.TU.scf_624.7   scf_624:50726-58002(+)
MWPYRCIMRKELLPIEEKPFPGPYIPGFTEHVKEVTISEFKSHERLMVRYLCECTGACYSGQLTVPTQTSHLIANDLTSNSQKIQSAKRCSTVKIVSKMWLNDCIAQWRHVPEGPYTSTAVPESPEENGVSSDAARAQILATPQMQQESTTPCETEVVGNRLEEIPKDSKAAGHKMDEGPNSNVSCRPEKAVVPERGEGEAVRDTSLEAHEHPPCNDAEGSIGSKMPQGASEMVSFTCGAASEGLDGLQQVGMAAATIGQLDFQLTPAVEPTPEIPATEAVDDPSIGTEVQGMDSVRQSGDQNLGHSDPSGNPCAMQTAPISERPGSPPTPADLQEAPNVCLDDARETATTSPGSTAGEHKGDASDGNLNVEERIVGTASAADDKAKPFHCAEDGTAGDSVVAKAHRTCAKGAQQLPTGSDAPGPAANGLCEHGGDGAATGMARRKWKAPRMSGSASSGKQRDTPKGTSGDLEETGRPTTGKRSAVETGADGEHGGQGAGQELCTSQEQNGLVEHQPSTSGRRNAFKKAKRGAETPLTVPQRAARKSGLRGGKEMAKRECGDTAGAEASNSKRLRMSDVGPRAEKKDMVVALSGVHSSQRLRYSGVLAGLHVQCTSGAHDAKHQWVNSITHIVSPSLKRNEKTVCGMAAGSWFVSTGYVEACARKHRMLDPADYELQKGKEDAISKGAPAHWRTRRVLTGAGAFDGITAVIYGKVGPPGEETIRRIICAGDGRVVKHPSSLSYESQGINLAVVGKEKPKSDRVVKQLLDSGVLCVSTDYIIDWVCHPSKALSMHRLFGTSPSPLLKTLEEGRMSKEKCEMLVSCKT